jgi:hypothetical protein
MQYYTIQYLNIVPEDDVNLAVLSAVKTLLKNVLKSVIPSPPRSQTTVNRCFVSLNPPIVFSIHSLPVLCSVLYVSCMCACVNGPSVSRLSVPYCKLFEPRGKQNGRHLCCRRFKSDLGENQLQVCLRFTFFLLIHCKFPSLSHTVAKKADWQPALCALGPSHMFAFVFGNATVQMFIGGAPGVC